MADIELVIKIPEEDFERCKKKLQMRLNVMAIAIAKGKPLKKGRWITQWNGVHQKEYYYCSECREEFSYDGETGIKMNDYDFCPNCGADMRGE